MRLKETVRLVSALLALAGSLAVAEAASLPLLDRDIRSGPGEIVRSGERLTAAPEICFTTRARGNALVRVLDVAGRLVRKLRRDDSSAGRTAVRVRP